MGYFDLVDSRTLDIINIGETTIPLKVNGADVTLLPGETASFDTKTGKKKTKKKPKGPPA